MNFFSRLCLLAVCLSCTFSALAQDPVHPGFKLEVKVFTAPEAVWKKLCKDEPGFTAYASSFPGLNLPPPVYGDLAKKLTTPEKDPWTVPVDSGLHDYRLLGTLAPDDFSKMHSALENTDGARLVFSPVVTTGDQKEAVIRTWMDVKFPVEFQENKDRRPVQGVDDDDKPTTTIPPKFTGTSFGTTKVGWVMKLKPISGKNGDVDLEVNLTDTSLIGYATEQNGKKIMVPADELEVPVHTVFMNSEAKASLTMKPGQTLLWGNMHPDRDFIPDANSAGQDGYHPTRSIVLIFVTLKTADAQ